MFSGKVQWNVPQLIVTREDGSEKLINDQKEVEKEILDFHVDLFECKDNFIEFNSVAEFLGAENCENIPKLNEGEKAKMEGRISLDEMTKYLKKSKNNVAPGSSGILQVLLERSQTFCH